MEKAVNRWSGKKSKIIFLLNILGWLMLFIGLFMGAIRSTANDPNLYFRYQLEARVLDYAGISEEDLLQLDVNLARYLFGRQDDPNAEIPVFGTVQPAFNEKEMIHLRDCRKLLAVTMNVPLNCFLAIAGALLTSAGQWRMPKRVDPRPMWIASAVILLPIAMLGLWAAVDFNSAFNFFHQILFTNDLWLLNPYTDLLIRICPASMFAGMGLRIGIMTAFALLGLPLIITVSHHLSERKRKSYETDL